MKVYKEIDDLYDFEAWSGGAYTKEKILDAEKGKEFMQLADELFPDGIDETGLNDFLWFEDQYIFDCLEISGDEDTED